MRKTWTALPALLVVVLGCRRTDVLMSEPAIVLEDAVEYGPTGIGPLYYPRITAIIYPKGEYDTVFYDWYVFAHEAECVEPRWQADDFELWPPCVHIGDAGRIDIDQLRTGPVTLSLYPRTCTNLGFGTMPIETQAYYFSAGTFGGNFFPDGGMPVGVAATGGLDAPAFSVEVPAPDPLAVYDPGGFMGDQLLAAWPTTLRWEPGNGDFVIVRYQYHRQSWGRKWYLDCRSDDDGEFALPAEWTDWFAGLPDDANDQAVEIMRVVVSEPIDIGYRVDHRKYPLHVYNVVSSTIGVRP
ncbi:MAG TPA: hypothetical protein VG389_27195 [Myxococcota bacterium]|jgi:hypothetical protein|nr:hypothetical protein [Myxococcota bacterium]